MAESLLQAPFVSAAGEARGDIDLPGSVFGMPGTPHLLFEAVRMQLANRRAGTASTKTRSQVRGGGRKPYRQKGTGRARQGSTRATQWVGGATVFGPQARDHGYRLPRSARRTAIRRALSERAVDGKVLVVEEISIPSGKTRDAVTFLGGLGLSSALLVVAEENETVRRAVANLPKVKLLSASAVNVHDVLRHERLVLTPEAIRALEGRLSA